MSKTTSSMLIFALACSTLFFGYHYFSTDDSVAPPVIDCACDDSGRYSDEPKEGGGKSIPDSEAQEMFQSFKDAADPVFNQYGSWISKQAIDQMFCDNMESNGLFIVGAAKRDDTSEKYDLQLILSAGKMDSISIRYTKGERFFLTEYVACPPTCGMEVIELH